MFRFRVLFLFLILAAISSRIILGELIQPVFYLSIILTTVLILITLLNMDKLINLIKDKTAILPFVVIIIFLLLPIQYIYLRLLLLAIFCFFMGKILKPLDPADSSLLWIAGLTIFLFTIILWIYKADPVIWTGLQYISERISSLIGDISNQKILLSVTSAGIPITILFILAGISISTFLVSSSKLKRELIIYIALCLLGNSIFIAILHPLTNTIQTLIQDIEIDPPDILFALVLIESLPLIWLIRNVKPGIVDYGFIPKRNTPLIIIIVCIVLSSLIVHPLFNKKEQESKTILIYNQGYFNWDKPVFGSYGLTAEACSDCFQNILKLWGTK